MRYLYQGDEFAWGPNEEQLGADVLTLVWWLGVQPSRQLLHDVACAIWETLTGASPPTLKMDAATWASIAGRRLANRHFQDGGDLIVE